ncbi:T9SS type A sorting domain-containing protein [Flavivirga amylovorans]|uniref:T9SS type A sorting domain-containing protein n=1 Tax=Flavivirga amylovorans TaxID=870486 RepID=A0ABT8X3V8_9FLAO|nr:T9SS type A sorting domain-containing protein [Flavivirga amylovorans]MDO5988527.1 T9SS type A sorting domain-containing protein [Flavivirga amylovorans]
MKKKTFYFFYISFFYFFLAQSQPLIDVPRGMRLITPVHYSFGCAAAPDGSVYFTEFNRQMLRQVGADGGVAIKRIGLTGMFAAAFDDSGNLFVGRDLGDVGNAAIITRIESNGTETNIVTGITRPRGIATDASGNVYFATESPSRISRWNQSNGSVDILVDNLLSPAEGVAVASDGTLYFSEYGNPESGVSGSVKKRATNGTISTVLSSGIWRSRGLAIDNADEFLYLCTEADQSDHGNTGLLVKIRLSNGLATNALQGIDYPQFPSIGADGNVYFTLTRDSWLAMYDPSTITDVSDWSDNSSVKIGLSEGDWTSGGNGTPLTIEVDNTLTFTGNISADVTDGTVQGWIRIPESLLSVDTNELYLPCYTSENPTPGIFKLPKVTYSVGTGSCLISAVVVRDQIGQRWPMQNPGTCNESPAVGFSEEPTGYLIYFSWSTADRIGTIALPSYRDTDDTMTIMTGSGPGWIYTGVPWNVTGQTWLNNGAVMSIPNETAWAEKDLGAFSGTSKYIYVMWHKNGSFRADAARYRVYDYTEDKYNGTVNQWVHADNVNRQDDTFSGWYLLDNKKINITPSTRIRMSQDAPVIGGQEFMQSDAVLLTDYPIVDNTSLGSASNFESFPNLSVSSSGEQGVGHHWGMQGLGYQYTVTDGNSFATKLDPNVFSDLLEEDYYVEVSWDYLDTDGINVTNAKYRVMGVETSDVVNQNRETTNQGGGFVSGNSIGSWSGFFRLDGKHTHTTANPIIVSGVYNNTQYAGKRLVYDMIRFIPESQLATLSNNSFDLEKKGEMQIRNYPNPVETETTFMYSLPIGGKVSLKVYDLSGVCMSNLMIDEFQSKGSHTIKFDANNLSSGLYLYTLNLDGNTVSGKMIVSK